MHQHPIGDIFRRPGGRVGTGRVRVPKVAWGAGVLAVALAAALWWSRAHVEHTVAAAPGTAVVCDCCGPISDWMLSLPDRESMFFESTQASLIAKADPRIRFHVFYGVDARREGLEKALARLGWRDNGRLEWHKSPKGVWPWTRDLFLAAATPDGDPVTLLHDPKHYRRWEISWKTTEMDTFANAMRAAAVPTSLWIDGGAIVVDEERILVSKFFVDESIRRGESPNPAAVTARMRAQWGRPVEVVEPGLVTASHHCDLAMMPACEKRMVLASPVLGAQLLRSTGMEERARFRAAYRQFAQRAPRGHRIHGKRDLDIVAALLRRNSRPEVRRGYERLRRQVERLGYTCVEVPLLTLHPADGTFGMTMSYANAVVDDHHGKRVVYMPTYGLPTLDHAAAEVWRKLGIRVVAIEALGPALNDGAIHCLSQMFRRPHEAISH